MSLVRAISLIIALLVQALPVSVWAQDDAPPHCGMGCCDVGAKSCCCAEPAQAPAEPAPASAPPITGRELLPALLWHEQTPFHPLEVASVETEARCDERRAHPEPHVRLAVLHCSMLI